jgi:predicted nucleic acid-binding protein
MSLVLDSSATLAWVFEDEVTDLIDRVFDLVAERGAWVPSLWKLEIANTLETSVRRGRIPAAFQSSTLRDLSLLPLRIDAETDIHAWGATLELAQRHQLTLYDAAYLELALRRGLPLASLDRELCAAAKAEAVIVLGS